MLFLKKQNKKMRACLILLAIALAGTGNWLSEQILIQRCCKSWKPKFSNKIEKTKDSGEYRGNHQLNKKNIPDI